MSGTYWGHGLGFGAVAAVVWLSAVIYLLTLATRLVRAIERIATKFEAKP
jgi:heme exporter protein D